MTDLRIAIDQEYGLLSDDLNYDSEACDHTDAHNSEWYPVCEPCMTVIVEAASRWADLLDQEPIWWCETHEAKADVSWDGSVICAVYKVVDCRMVRVRLSEVNE